MNNKKQLAIYLTIGGKIIKSIKLDDEKKTKKYKPIFDKLLGM